MKKTILSLAGIVAFGLSLNAQTTTIDLSNAREGENVEYCTQHKKHAELLQDPTYVETLAQDELIRAQEASQGLTSTQKATTYYIPVVFHLLHNNGPEKIDDEQMFDALDILNRDYALQNADAANVVNAFNASNPAATTIPADVDIQFRLATIAPDGTCFNGITHTVNALSNDGSSGSDQVSAIVNGNDVYQGTWPPTDYLNIYVCGEIGGAAGYTFNPFGNGGSMYFNGIFILHNYTGTIGTSSPFTGRSLTHEVGHWLNLSHPWGGNNNPGNASSCNEDDGVQDTPICIGLTSCILAANTCSNDNGYWGFDQIDNTENYMDYSYCSKMFTQGQVNRMRNALLSSVAGRNQLITAGNLASTGADGNLFLCRADFSADRTSVCAGDVINFTDESINAATGWTWSFPGGTPSSSTSQNPTITYDTPGIYEVSLSATDGAQNDSEVKTAFIRVLPGASALPFLESFESYNTLNNIEEWEIKNEEGNGFILATNTGHTGTKCAKLGNNGQAVGTFDELIAAPVDLSGISSAVTLSYRYAYKRKNTSDDDWFRVYVTSDCGENWDLRKTQHGFQLSSLTQTSQFTPSSQDDWTTVHMTNITSGYWVDNFRYKFQFEAGGGNNMYIDDINIYSGSPSDELVTADAGLTEGTLVSGLGVYPNPTEGELNIRFNMGGDEDAVIYIQNVAGQITQQSLVKAKTGSNLVLVDTNNLASGLYFLKLQVGKSQQTVQFVVK